jgi:hypothetical protein
MPDLKFYFSQEERIELVRYLLEENFTIVKVKEYLHPKYDTVDSVEAFIDAYSQDEIRFFLLRGDYTFEALEFVQLKSRPFYFIDQRVGGPYIDLSFYLGFAKDALIKYKSSWISHYPRYIHVGQTEEFEVPIELKTAYTKITKFIKARSSKVLVNGLNFIVSKSVLSELEMS